ncbi:hypothetical protein ACVIGA_005158 [Bradyrhizobium sp. USDA 3240]
MEEFGQWLTNVSWMLASSAYPSIPDQRIQDPHDHDRDSEVLCVRLLLTQYFPDKGQLSVTLDQSLLASIATNHPLLSYAAIGEDEFQ